jgi:hypothetical protein
VRAVVGVIMTVIATGVGLIGGIIVASKIAEKLLQVSAALQPLL